MEKKTSNIRFWPTGKAEYAITEICRILNSGLPVRRTQTGRTKCYCDSASSDSAFFMEKGLEFR